MLRQERSAAQHAQDQLQAAEKELEHLRGSQEQLENAEKVQNRSRACWEFKSHAGIQHKKVGLVVAFPCGNTLLGRSLGSPQACLGRWTLSHRMTVKSQAVRELRLEGAGARRREASLKEAHAARVAQLEREVQTLRPAALHARELEARLADREQRLLKLRAEVGLIPTCPLITETHGAPYIAASEVLIHVNSIIRSCNASTHLRDL